MAKNSERLNTMESDSDVDTNFNKAIKNNPNYTIEIKKSKVVKKTAKNSDDESEEKPKKIVKKEESSDDDEEKEEEEEKQLTRSEIIVNNRMEEKNNKITYSDLFDKYVDMIAYKKELKIDNIDRGSTDFEDVIYDLILMFEYHNSMSDYLQQLYKAHPNRIGIRSRLYNDQKDRKGAVDSTWEYIKDPVRFIQREEIRKKKEAKKEEMRKKKDAEEEEKMNQLLKYAKEREAEEKEERKKKKAVKKEEPSDDEEEENPKPKTPKKSKKAVKKEESSDDEEEEKKPKSTKKRQSATELLEEENKKKIDEIKNIEYTPAEKKIMNIMNDYYDVIASNNETYIYKPTEQQLEFKNINSDKIPRIFEVYILLLDEGKSHANRSIPDSIYIIFFLLCKQFNVSFIKNIYMLLKDMNSRFKYETIKDIYDKQLTVTNDIYRGNFINKSILSDDGLEKLLLSFSSKRVMETLTYGGHSEMSNLVYSLYPTKMIYSSETRKWYKFGDYGHYEQEDNEVPSLHAILRNDIIKQIKKVTSGIMSFISSYQGDMDNEDDADKKDEIKQSITRLKSKSKKMTKCLENMQSIVFKNNIVSTMKLQYNNINAISRIDSNPYLFAFSDCVVDLRNRVCRKLHVIDYVSMNTGYKYIPEDDEYIIETIPKIMAIFRKIQPNEVELNYLLRTIASTLIGENTQHKLYFWTGEGANGKSFISNILKYVLGDYCQSLPALYITSSNTKKSNANAPDECLARLEKARCVIVPEVAQDEVDESLLKRLSGGDPIDARKLRENLGRSYTAGFKAFLSANKLPSLKNVSDHAMVRRIEVVTFNSRFVDNPDDVDEKNNIYSADKKLEKLIESSNVYRNAIFHILKNKLFEIFDANDDIVNITPPESFIIHTKEYMKDQNKILSLIEKYYTPTDNITDVVPFAQLVNKFREETKIKISDYSDMALSKDLNKTKIYETFRHTSFNNKTCVKHNKHVGLKYIDPSKKTYGINIDD